MSGVVAERDKGTATDASVEGSARRTTDRVAVVIASKGRPRMLTETVAALSRLRLGPERVILAVTAEADFEAAAASAPGVEVLICPPGLTKQRNAAIDAVADGVEFVLFLDDDMELAPDYLELGLAFMDAFPHVVAFSGELLADGGVSRGEAIGLCAGSDPSLDPSGARPAFRDTGKHWILHGCNMLIRTKAFAYERFDERLPLYAYGEDYDVSLRLRSLGRVGKFRGCRAVHLQEASGRVSSVRLGYSIVANNRHFLAKGLTHLPSLAAGYRRFWILFGFVFPLKKLSAGEFATFRGAMLALVDVMRGRSRPERILEL